jgi:hypothetical protein
MNSLERQIQLEQQKQINSKQRVDSYVKPPSRSSQALAKEVMMGGSSNSSLSSISFPGAGITISTGTAWGTSIADYSNNWNTAYSWGNHSSVGYWKSSFHPTTIAGYGITDILSFSGTAIDNQVAVWTSSNLLEGTTGLTYDGTTLHVEGNITASGEVSAFAGAAPIDWWDSMPLATTLDVGGILLDGTTTNYLRGDGTWQTVATGGGEMVYPSAGIGVSTGSGWTTSVVNNSSNWNSAYNWGNHASAGYAPIDSPNFTTDITTPFIYNSGSIQFLNKTGTDWLYFAQRNTSGSEAVYDITHVGSIIADSFKTSGATAFTLEQSGTKLNIKYGSTVVLSISSAGLLTAKDEVTAFGTP